MADPLDDVLSALDAVNWGRMVHCRGQAEDVPDLVRRALRDGGDEARNALWDALFYQGSSFEPTSHAGVVLMRAFPHVDAGRRLFLVRWAASLASAYTMTEGQGLLHWVPEGHADRAKIVAQYEREAIWAREARRAGWLAAPHLLGLIGDADPDLALQAPFALVRLLNAEDAAPDEASRLQVAEETVRRLLSATGTPKVCSGHAHALGNLAELVPSALDALRAFHDRGWPERTTAAVHLAWRGDERAADVLIESLGLRAQHEDWYPYPYPWRFGHTRYAITRVLCHSGVPRSVFERAVPVFADVIRHDTWNGGFEGDVLLPLARALDGRPVTDPPPLARTLLEALRDSESFWKPPRIGNSSNAMRPLGLQNDRDFVRALLG